MDSTYECMWCRHADVSLRAVRTSVAELPSEVPEKTRCVPSTEIND